MTQLLFRQCLAFVSDVLLSLFFFRALPPPNSFRLEKNWVDLGRLSVPRADLFPLRAIVCRGFLSPAGHVRSCTSLSKSAAASGAGVFHASCGKQLQKDLRPDQRSARHRQGKRPAPRIRPEKRESRAGKVRWKSSRFTRGKRCISSDSPDSAPMIQAGDANWHPLFSLYEIYINLSCPR